MGERLKSTVYETGVKGYMHLELARYADHFPPPGFSGEERQKAQDERSYIQAFGGLLRLQLGLQLYEQMTNEAADRIYGLVAAIDEVEEDMQ